MKVMKASQMRIFLAEDNLGDVFLIEEALRRQSLVCEIDHYATAEDAIHAAELCGSVNAPLPDLMMLDYNLPRGNGSDILAAAARNAKLAAVPKVIVTSFLQPDELAQALQLGANCLITKPVDFEAFMRDVGAKVAELLNTGGASETTVL
jgi:chemotaxis family two-component system response regulator Rcp1